MKTHSLRFGGLAALVMVLSAPVVYAAEAVLMDGGQVTITEQDMHADALRMPLEMRERVLARPDQVAQIASNLYVRRSLAQQADAAGLASNPETKAALQIARDKVLSDALLAKIDKDNALPDAKLEGLARSNYNANPDRFKVAEQVQVRHILIASPDDAGRAKAAQVLVDLQGGADFAALAKEYSADPGSAAKGGELGFFAKGAMVPEFEEAAFALKKKGELSGLVKTKFGYHILQLEARRPAGVRSFEEVRDDLIKGARATVQQEARALAAQKAQQGVTVHKEAVEAFAAGYKSAP
mgnify:FL=1